MINEDFLKEDIQTKKKMMKILLISSIVVSFLFAVAIIYANNKNLYSISKETFDKKEDLLYAKKYLNSYINKNDTNIFYVLNEITNSGYNKNNSYTSKVVEYVKKSEDKIGKKNTITYIEKYLIDEIKTVIERKREPFDYFETEYQYLIINLNDSFKELDEVSDEDKFENAKKELIESLNKEKINELKKEPIQKQEIKKEEVIQNNKDVKKSIKELFPDDEEPIETKKVSLSENKNYEEKTDVNLDDSKPIDEINKTSDGNIFVIPVQKEIIQSQEEINSDYEEKKF